MYVARGGVLDWVCGLILLLTWWMMIWHAMTVNRLPGKYVEEGFGSALGLITCILFTALWIYGTQFTDNPTACDIRSRSHLIFGIDSCSLKDMFYFEWHWHCRLDCDILPLSLTAIIQETRKAKNIGSDDGWSLVDFGEDIFFAICSLFIRV